MSEMNEAELDYFCYISRKKVDDLYEQLDPKAYYERSEKKSKTVDIKVSADANWGIGHIISLFKLGGTYGRKGVIQYEAKVKLGYIEKLRQVLVALAAQSVIPPLSDAEVTEFTQSGFYHYSGLFRIDEPMAKEKLNEDRVITLVSSVGSKNLLLDASLRYFSTALPDGTFTENSSNRRFFMGDIDLPMTCVLLLLEATPERIVGTPLFLKLSYVKAGPFAAEL